MEDGNILLQLVEQLENDLSPVVKGKGVLQPQGAAIGKAVLIFPPLLAANALASAPTPATPLVSTVVTSPPVVFPLFFPAFVTLSGTPMPRPRRHGPMEHPRPMCTRPCTRS